VLEDTLLARTSRCVPPEAGTMHDLSEQWEKTDANTPAIMSGKAYIWSADNSVHKVGTRTLPPIDRQALAHIRASLLERYLKPSSDSLAIASNWNTGNAIPDHQAAEDLETAVTYFLWFVGERLGEHRVVEALWLLSGGLLLVRWLVSSARPVVRDLVPSSHRPRPSTTSRVSDRRKRLKNFSTYATPFPYAAINDLSPCRAVPPVADRYQGEPDTPDIARKESTNERDPVLQSSQPHPRSLNFGAPL
jgi:hypothetical protein